MTIPALETLQAIPQWVAWKIEERRGKLTKIPKNPRTGGNASSTNPATWGSYQQAVQAVKRYGLDGVGFVFTAGDVFAGIDLDDCINDGHLEEWAARIVARIDSYTEISPSGRGLKIFIRAELPSSGKKGQIEMYDRDRYFTVTGRQWPGAPDTIEERTEPAAELWRDVFGPVTPQLSHSVTGPAAVTDQAVFLPKGNTPDDLDLIERAMNAANGARFTRLWNGDSSGHHSRSEAHLALCNILAFWTGSDAGRMDRLFRQSAFFTDYAEKWDQRHRADGRTYGQATIDKAIEQQQQFYTARTARNGDSSGPLARNGDADHTTTTGDAPTEAEQPTSVGNGDAAGSIAADNDAAATDSMEYVPHYIVEFGQMVHISWKSVGGELVKLKKYVAPFVCSIEEKMTIYNETGQEVVYTLTGRKGRIPFTAEITADDWADPRRLVSAILRYLPGKPPDTDPALRQHWGPAIAHLTEEEKMRQVKAISSTGWTPDGKAFVMPGGGVGQGYVCNLDENMAAELKHFGLKEQDREKNRAALAALLALVKVYRETVVYTLLAHVFLPPLLRFVGDEARYLYHIHAETGSYKTELAKFVMGLYGPQGSAAITYKWSNTPYGAESRAYTLKDCLLVLDDLKPGTISEADKQKWVAFVQAAVDALGRKRATISGRAATSMPPRALILSTGEAIPEAGEASYTARMILAELNKQPEGRNLLLDRLKLRIPLLAGLMYDYIAWLLAGDGQGAADTYRELQQHGITTSHARLAANFASNRLGAVMLVKFCRDRGYLGQRAGEIVLRRHQQALLGVVASTDSKAQSERYSQRFIIALKDALDTGFCYLVAETKPDEVPAWRDKRVGWQDDTYIYLLSGAKEIVDQWLRQSGQTPINISKKELRKQLYDDGLSYSTEGRRNRSQYDYQALDPITGVKLMVVALYKANFNRVANDEE
jgi:hypothetical protein